MGSVEANTHVFVVRIWAEEEAGPAGCTQWRGYVKHLVTGEYRYVQDLDAMVAFVASYLPSLGVEPSPRPGPQRPPGETLH